MTFVSRGPGMYGTIPKKEKRQKTQRESVGLAMNLSRN